MQFQTPAISYYFDKEHNNMRRRPSMLSNFLNFFKFWEGGWNLEYIGNPHLPHLIMWRLQLTPQELRPRMTMRMEQFWPNSLQQQ